MKKNTPEQNHPAVEGWLITEVRINTLDDGHEIDRDSVSAWTGIYRSRAEQKNALREAIADAYNDHYEGRDIDEGDREATVNAVIEDRDVMSDTYQLLLCGTTYIWQLDSRMVQVD